MEYWAQLLDDVVVVTPLLDRLRHRDLKLEGKNERLFISPTLPLPAFHPVHKPSPCADAAQLTGEIAQESAHFIRQPVHTFTK